MLSLLLGLAAALRILFYTGFFGSDEVTYIESAVKITNGDWHASDYIGATRYVMNLPIALFISLFGLSEFSANLWPFICSVGEVALVFTIARWLWNTKAAVISAGLLALMPIHVHFAGRMMADSPLAFFLSFSMALLIYGAHSKSWLSLMMAGLAWGGVFWVKESVALLYAPVFMLLSVVLNRVNVKLLWVLTGMGIAVAANCYLMYLVSGNPLHIFVVMQKAIVNVAGMTEKTSPWFYLRYLFLDIRHTLFLGLLAVAGVLLFTRYYFHGVQTHPATQFVIFWSFLMVGMFSLAVVSFSPIQLVMKQTNYMLIFLCPLVLLAGWFLAELPPRVLNSLSVLLALGSLLLIALEQQAVTVFTANSKSSYDFLRSHPNTYLLATTNNERAVDFYSLMDNRPELRHQVSSFGDMDITDHAGLPVSLATRTLGKKVFAVVDLQTIGWGSKPGAMRGPADTPTCWNPVSTLPPAELGRGHWVARQLMAAGFWLPESLRRAYSLLLQPVSTPAPAYLYSVDTACLPQSARSARL